MGVGDSTERPKFRRSWRKGYRKTNKDLGMSCYIQVEYSDIYIYIASITDIIAMIEDICTN